MAARFFAGIESLARSFMPGLRGEAVPKSGG